MASYSGNAGDSQRIRKLLEQRERQRRENVEEQNKLDKETRMAAHITDKFASYKDEVEDQIKASTVGLVSLFDMRAKQTQIIEDRDLRTLKDKAAKLKREEKAKRDAKKLKDRKRKARLQKLSFVDDENEATSSEDDDEKQRRRAKKVLRNQAADSSYLPNAAKDENELELRKILRSEWEANQEMEKNRVFSLPFDYWDGTGHRFEAQIKKGNTIYQFLTRALDVMKADINELRHATPEHLVYVKDDLILPHYYTFYELILNNIVSKTGKMLKFETAEMPIISNITYPVPEPDEPAKKIVDGDGFAVPKPPQSSERYDDDRVKDLRDIMTSGATNDRNFDEDTLPDDGDGLSVTKEGYTYDRGTETGSIEAMTGLKKGSTVMHLPHAAIEVKVEENEAAIGKVILRSWYEKNKHIFPASRWEAFDPVTMMNVDELTRKQTQADVDYYAKVL